MLERNGLIKAKKKNEMISSARFVCNKKGCSKENKRYHLTKFSRAETTTNVLYV